MDVPNFFTPHYAWTYMDEDQGRGSANWVEREKERCSNYTFDYETTNVAFYKQYVTLFGDLTGRTYSLTFDGIGKDGEVWVNGLPAGVHSGLFTTSKFDVTHLVKPGENTITVKVGDFTSFDITDPSVPGVVEREPIEKKLGASYPNGMLFSRNLGIWQGVSLTVSGGINIDDTFFRPELNRYALNVTVSNKKDSPQQFSMASQIRSYEDNSIIYDSYYSSRVKDVTIDAAVQYDGIILEDSKEHEPFRNWSPEFPHLYKIDIFTYRYNQRPFVSLTEFASPLLKLNFQPYGTVTPIGWTAAGADIYNPSRGFGWDVLQETRKRGILADHLLDSLVTINRGSEATFICDVPNGDYVLSLQFGDPSFPTLAEAYIGNDTRDINKVIVRDAVNMNTPVIALKSLTVEDGKLQITIPSMPIPAIGTSLNWLVLEPRAAVTAAKWVSCEALLISKFYRRIVSKTHKTFFPFFTLVSFPAS